MTPAMRGSKTTRATTIASSVPTSPNSVMLGMSTPETDVPTPTSTERTSSAVFLLSRSSQDERM